MNTTRAAAVLLAFALCAGCAPEPSGTPGPEPAGTPTGEQLANAAIAGIYDEPVRLSGGTYVGEPFVEGGASRPTVRLLEPRLMADLDGAPGEEAIVLLSEDSGGSGTYLYMAAIGLRKGRPVNLDTFPIGDRAQVRSLEVAGGRVRLGLLVHGEEDAACCPSRLVSRTWALRDGRLVMVEEWVQGTLSMEILEGREWVLKGGAPDDPEVTILFEEGRISGSAGCNRYFAEIEEKTPGVVEIGAIGSTRMACPGVAMKVERRFLERLASVTGYGFHLGDLALSWQSETDAGNLLFKPR
jgi:heat shock protein HslJ